MRMTVKLHYYLPDFDPSDREALARLDPGLDGRLTAEEVVTGLSTETLDPFLKIVRGYNYQREELAEFYREVNRLNPEKAAYVGSVLLQNSRLPEIRALARGGLLFQEPHYRGEVFRKSTTGLAKGVTGGLKTSPDLRLLGTGIERVPPTEVQALFSRHQTQLHTGIPILTPLLGCLGALVGVETTDQTLRRTIAEEASDRGVFQLLVEFLERGGDFAVSSDHSEYHPEGPEIQILLDVDDDEGVSGPLRMLKENPVNKVSHELGHFAFDAADAALWEETRESSGVDDHEVLTELDDRWAIIRDFRRGRIPDEVQGRIDYGFHEYLKDRFWQRLEDQSFYRDEVGRRRLNLWDDRFRLRTDREIHQEIDGRFMTVAEEPYRLDRPEKPLTVLITPQTVAVVSSNFSRYSNYDLQTPTWKYDNGEPPTPAQEKFIRETVDRMRRDPTFGRRKGLLLTDAQIEDIVSLAGSNALIIQEALRLARKIAKQKGYTGDTSLAEAVATPDFRNRFDSFLRTFLPRTSQESGRPAHEVAREVMDKLIQEL